jgi:hypothetical protein
MTRRFQLVACAASAIVALTGCESDTFVPPRPTETSVRFVNATQRDTIDVVTNGAVAPANQNLAFGAATACITMKAATPAISFRAKGTSTDLAGFTPSFTAGHNYWVVAVSGATAPQFVTIDQTFTPTTAATDNGIAGLNAINGTATYDLHVTLPGAALGSSTVTRGALAFPTASAFVNNTIPFSSGTPPTAQPQQVRFTTSGSTTLVRDHGIATMTPGKSALAILAPGAPATPSTLRSVVVDGC